MFDYYKFTLKIFKKVLKYNKSLTEQEWDKYASDNNLFSSFTLKAKNDVDNFEELKQKIKFF